jgi:hypothetical protein
LADKPFEPLILKGTVPFRAYVEDGFLYVDARIFTGDTAEPIIEVARNQYKRIPPGWDVNSTPAALEIVNERGEPVFHLIYKSPSEAKIEGVFQTPGGAYVINEHGEGYGLRPNIKPVFKYPSWKYPGQYADQPPAPDERGGGRHRTLTNEQRTGFVEALRSQPPPREEVMVGCPAASEEACVFAAQFIDLFQEAGWVVRGNRVERGMLGKPDAGVVLMKRGEGTLDPSDPRSGLWVQQSTSMQTLEKAFASADMGTKQSAVVQMPEGVIGVFVGIEP